MTRKLRDFAYEWAPLLVVLAAGLYMVSVIGLPAP